MAPLLRIDNRKFYYEAAVDPSATDKPYRNAAEWRNTATGDIFDWDRYAESWTKRVPATATSLATLIHAATGKTTPVNADEVPIWNSVGSVLGKVTWANIKATLKSYFDGLYAAIAHTHAHNDTTALNTGDYQHLTAAQLAILEDYPAIPGGSTTFLRSDGTFATPASVVTQNFMQMGGSAADEILDVKYDSVSGDIFLLIRTKSTVFCGIDIAAYTNATYWAYGILKIDPNLPPHRWLKGYYFITGNGKGMGSTEPWSKHSKIELDTSGNIFYTYGDNAAGNKTGWKIYGVRASDMTLQWTADTSITVNCSATYGQAEFINHKLYSGNWYVSYFDGSNYRIQILNSTLVQQSDTSIKANRLVVDSEVNANGVFALCYYSTGQYIVKSTLVPAYSTEVDISGAGTVCAINAIEGISISSTDIYYSGVESGGNDLIVKAYKQSDLTAKAGWTEYKRATAGGKYAFSKGIKYDIANSRLFVIARCSDGSVGVEDPLLIEINGGTGAGIAENFLAYSNGDTVGQTSKYHTTAQTVCLVSSSLWLCAWFTQGTVPLYIGAGSDDICLAYVNFSGVIAFP